MKHSRLFAVLLLALFFALTPPHPAQASDQSYCLIPGYYYTGVTGTSQASNNDTVSVAGTTFINVRPDYSFEYFFGTTFVHRDPAGSVLHSGTWEPVRLQALKEFGCNPELPYSFGGYMVLKIRLLDTDGSVYNGTLELELPEGDPPANAVLRMRLTVKDWGLTFDQFIDGLIFMVIF